MILLESYHGIIVDALKSRMASNGEKSKPEPILITAADFDDVTYQVASTTEEPNVVTVSIQMRCAKELLALDSVKAMLEKTYGKLVVDPISGYDVTLRVDVNDLPPEPERMVLDVAQIKRHLLAAPLAQVMDTIDKKGAVEKPFHIEYRPDEYCWVIPKEDQVTVVFGILFRDPTDIAIGKVFLQEFAEARRQGGLGTAPPVSYSMEPPLELKGMQYVTEADNKSYVSFVLFPRNWDTEKKRESSLTQIQSFRNYLHYHIKCSKAYMHTRMRARVASLIKILKLAVPPTEEKGGTKTASGRTFVRPT